MKEIDMTATGKINAVLEHFRDGAAAPGMDTVLEVLELARIGAAVQPRPFLDKYLAEWPCQNDKVDGEWKVIGNTLCWSRNYFLPYEIFIPLSALPKVKL